MQQALPSLEHLDYGVRFELEVLLREAVLAPADLSSEFVARLTDQNARQILRRMRLGGGRSADAGADFDFWSGRACLAQPRANTFFLEVYSVYVTPTRTLARPVSVERSSRTQRAVHQLMGSTDHMLRVAFVGD